MRFTHLTTKNVAGVADGKTTFPNERVVALAGPNGVGKSRLLRCLMIPWSSFNHPTAPADKSTVLEVEVGLEFSESEVEAQSRYLAESGFFPAEPVHKATFKYSYLPLNGPRLSVEPQEAHFLQTMLQQTQVLEQYPSLSLLYIPAERRLASNGDAFSITSLDPETNIRTLAQTRDAANMQGVLDDWEFLDYARTLCIAAYLPDRAGETSGAARESWDRFLEGVNGVLAPKKLLPLTQDHPGELQIELPSGHTHRIEDLSSGERQALILISRVFRAGEGQTSAIIDEPDAFLHPALSARLLSALTLGVATQASLLIATHSPAILDMLSPSAILRLDNDTTPRPLNDEDDRLELYRNAGFRASALTQADLLISTEGSFDQAVLNTCIAEASRASIRPAGGRALVVRNTTAITLFNDIPVLGIVDRDVLADEIDVEIADRIHAWPRADIEGVLISDESFLDAAVRARLVTPSTVDDLKGEINAAVEQFRDQTVAELAIRIVRSNASADWPSPKHTDPRAALEQAVADLSRRISASAAGEAWAEAEDLWTRTPNKLDLVRGKYVLNRLARILETRTTDAFVLATLAHRPPVEEMEKVRHRIRRLLELEQ